MTQPKMPGVGGFNVETRIASQINAAQPHAANLNSKEIYAARISISNKP
jgi:hypothetical protein